MSDDTQKRQNPQNTTVDNFDEDFDRELNADVGAPQGAHNDADFYVVDPSGDDIIIASIGSDQSDSDQFSGGSGAQDSWKKSTTGDNREMEDDY